jgi:chaperonin GroES
MEPNGSKTGAIWFFLSSRMCDRKHVPSAGNQHSWTSFASTPRCGYIWHSIPESANEAKGGLNMTLQPLDDRIVVRPSEAVETTASGLVIPDTAQEKPQQGEVLAVGPGRRADSTGEIIPLDVAVGDKVVYSKYGGTEITIDGEDLLILTSRDVLAKVSA